MEKKANYNFGYFVIAVLGILLLQQLWMQGAQVQSIPYNEFQTFLEAGQVEEIAISETQIHGTLKQQKPDGRRRFVTTRVEPSLADELARYGVRFSGVERSFLVYSPNVESVEVVRRGIVRRAKLYYLRGLSGRAARIKERTQSGKR